MHSSIVYKAGQSRVGFNDRDGGKGDAQGLERRWRWGELRSNGDDVNSAAVVALYT